MAKKLESRRDFLKTSAAVGATLAANLSLLSNVHAEGSDTIRVGLIGCGGRGSGAAENVLSSAKSVKLVALGDVFQDRIDGLKNRVKEFAANDERVKQLGNSVDLPDDRCFVGFDAYEKVIANCDYVMLATPPGFRPIHLQAAVAAGKNIFTEKPVATDPTGIRKVLAAYEDANQKKLCIVAGTQRRHQYGYLETLKRVHDGAIGTITSGRCYWNQGSIWAHDRKPDWNEMTYQLRNWYHFTWLCGDHIVEQHVHNLDVINWALGQHPVRCVGMGGRLSAGIPQNLHVQVVEIEGRQMQVDPKYGESFDHFAVEYEDSHGVYVLSHSRQIDVCDCDVV